MQALLRSSCGSIGARASALLRNPAMLQPRLIPAGSARSWSNDQVASKQAIPQAAAYDTRSAPQYESESSANNAGIPRSFVQYSVYKGKGAVQFRFIPPSWKSIGDKGWVVDREGVLFLELANAVSGGSGGGYGERHYGWDNKVTFGMNVTELGQLLTEEGRGMDLYHDPGKGSPTEGQVRKSLKLARNPDQSYMLTVSQTNQRENTRAAVTVPLTPAEFAVVKSLANYAIPRLLGFDMLFEGANHVPPSTSYGSYGGNGTY